MVIAESFEIFALANFPWSFGAIVTLRVR